MRIFLEFAPEQSPAHRARLAYAFRLFCATYAHKPVLEPERADSADVWISYLAGPSDLRPPRVIRLSNLYQIRKLQTPAPPPQPFEIDGERTVLFQSPHDVEESDWLGEIFEWVSCADEYSIEARDSVGRIRFRESYVGRYKLDAHRPYAALAMQFLQRELCKVIPSTSPQPISPVAGISHFIINTHDVDFLPLRYSESLIRLAKNVAISLLLHKRPRLAMGQAGKALRLAFGGANPLYQVSPVADHEVRQGISASYFFIANNGHRRDAKYSINEPAVIELMRWLEVRGMEVGVHGSYTSLDYRQGLVSEFSKLYAKGFRPRGGRQHWLRFTLPLLIRAMERVGALYDTSLGWTEQIGFRAGACFAFPPYNFDEERPAAFLEIPLVVMDGSLIDQNTKEVDWYNEITELLSMSRRYGWGGISLLWHPTAFGGGQLPQEMDSLFWQLVGCRGQWNDTWLSALDFVKSVRRRYEEVGLLSAEKQKEPALAFDDFYSRHTQNYTIGSP
jgi:hypothetical protein